MADSEALVEAACIAYNKVRNPGGDQWTAMTAAITAARPIIERETLERAAMVVQTLGFIEARDTEWDVGFNDAKRDIATAIRNIGEG